MYVHSDPAAAAVMRASSERKRRDDSRARDGVRKRLACALSRANTGYPDFPHPRLCKARLPAQEIFEPAVDIGAPHDDPYGVIWPWQGSPDASASQHHVQLDNLINLGIDNATVDGKRGRDSTGVRAWFAFAEDERLSPHRPMDPNSPLEAKLHEEWLAMRFCCALIQERGVAVNTAGQYFSQTQGWHSKEHGIKLAGGIKLERLPQMLKGLRRVLGDTPPKVRRGLAPQALRAAMDICLPDLDNPVHANLRAALATAFQGLLRGEEFAIDKKAVWRSAQRITRADIKEISATRLVLMLHPCKNMKILNGKSVPLVIGAGGKYIDAVAEVNNMLRVDPAAHLNPASVPIFRDPTNNACITKETVHALVKSLMVSIGENPEHFGTHSMRIGGATALFAQGADPTVIRTMGRWSSDIYKLYVRACFERCCTWTSMAGSAKVTNVVVEFDEVDYY